MEIWKKMWVGVFSEHSVVTSDIITPSAVGTSDYKHKNTIVMLANTMADTNWQLNVVGLSRCFCRMSISCSDVKSSASKLWPRPQGFGLGLASISLFYYFHAKIV